MDSKKSIEMNTFLMTHKLFWLASLSGMLMACSPSTEISTGDPIPAATVITPLVSAEWVQQHIDDSDLVILDVSVLVRMDDNGFETISGRNEYEKAHIPNARFADLKGNLSNQSTTEEFIMPSPEQFQKAIRELGVNNNSRLVLYSIDDQSWPARLWWMLRWAGFDHVSILDGGISAWKEQGFLLTAESSTIRSGDFMLELRSNVIADAGQVSAAITDENVTIVDSLSAVHYEGDFSMYPRAGHISSAINIPSSDFVDESGLFRPVDELELILEIDRDVRTITYCGGGVAASNVAFNLVRAGHTDVAVYMGSLQEWTKDPTNPMTIGETPEADK